MKFPSYVLRRGVWVCPWFDEDWRPMLVAIDSGGRSVAGPVRVFSRDQRSDVASMLERMLEAADPSTLN
jgi:hypothetical protein